MTGAICFQLALVVGSVVAVEPHAISAGTEPVALAISFDGASLAAASGESLKLYDPATGKETLSLVGHAWPVRAVAFSPDGKLLASAAGGFRDGMRGGEVRIWDAVAGELKHALAWRPDSGADAVAFAPDGKRLAAGGLRGLRQWDAATGTLEKEIETGAAVLALAYSPDGATLAAGAFTQYVHLWEVGTWKERVLKGHKSEVRAAAYSPEGKTLVTGGVGEFRVWDTASGELRKAVAHPDTVWAIAFGPDGEQIAIGSGEPRVDLGGSLGLWNAADWSRARRLSGGADGGAVRSVAISPDGEFVVAGRQDGTVQLHDLVTKDK